MEFSNTSFDRFNNLTSYKYIPIFIKRLMYKRIFAKFECSRAVLKFDGWQLKNGKITGKKWKIGQKLVKEWSNGLDLSIHGSLLSIV